MRWFLHDAACDPPVRISGGLNFQGGIRDDEFFLSTSLCELDPGGDYDAIYAELTAANRESGATLARFAEADCYLKVTSSTPLAEATPEMLSKMLRACVAEHRSKQKWTAHCVTSRFEPMHSFDIVARRKV